MRVGTVNPPGSPRWGGYGFIHSEFVETGSLVGTSLFNASDKAMERVNSE